MYNFSEQLENQLEKRSQNIDEQTDLKIYGRLTRVTGLALEAVGCYMPVGARCLIDCGFSRYAEAEVVGFRNEAIQMMLKHKASGITPGSKVIPLQLNNTVAVCDELLGRIIDASGQPLDGGSEIHSLTRYPLHPDPINPMTREIIHKQLDVGVRAINGFLTVGQGQRIGLFAGSGVGKSVLLGMMTRYSQVDCIVVGLIGERGREVKEFIFENLGEEGLKRSVVVVAAADQTALMRLQGAYLATTIAEYFRDQGRNVLLLMDSLTRFAQAQREISLSIGEPPTSKGYTPSVFSRLPSLVERAGNADGKQGSITAFYTVLAEGDDQNDPVADAARAILDGHIVLTRKLAEEGHYPAIEIETSISRVMPKVVNEQHFNHAAKFRRWYSKYQQNRDLMLVGAYMPGVDPELDRVIKYYPEMLKYLRQGLNEQVSMFDSTTQLKKIIEVIENERLS